MKMFLENIKKINLYKKACALLAFGNTEYNKKELSPAEKEGIQFFEKQNGTLTIPPLKIEKNSQENSKKRMELWAKKLMRTLKEKEIKELLTIAQKT